MNAQSLQELGLAVTFLSLCIALISFQMWKTLPNKDKIWAMVVFIGYCGILMIVCESLVGVQEMIR